ncbi:MAG: MerR family transcriptional regulator [Planctomycetes bacterium]|nr:MerR family transcriptional regulator [Planctomycetota bacterium]
MRTISERTGLSPSLLRAWERRHGLLQPERTEGGHRLYTETDLRVLQRVRDLLESGRSIGELASLGRQALLNGASSAAPAPRVQPTSPPVGPEVEETLQHYRGVIVQAAVGLDELALQRGLDESFALVRPCVALHQVVFPALREVGELWARGECSVAGEHLVSAKVVGRLIKLIEVANPEPGPQTPRAICACLPDEQHVIGALVTAYQLARHGFHVHYLGASMPLQDLERSCQVVAPRVVALSVVRPALLATHQPGLIAFAERAGREGVQVLLGGPGVRGADPKIAEAGVLLLDPVRTDLRDTLRSLSRI